MSISSIFASATSGLQTAQAGLRIVSDNISNVDTPGYVRKLMDQKSMVQSGAGGGVTVAQIRRATDQFLQSASLGATAQAGQASVLSDLFDQAQGLFGDPSGDTSFFSSLDQVFAGFSKLADDPTSVATRSQVLSQVSQFFTDSKSMASNLQGLTSQADNRLVVAVDQANSLISQIDTLNKSIAKATVDSGDATGLQEQQSQLINQLSSMMDIRVSARAMGGVSVRTGDGAELAGDGAAKLSYDLAGSQGRLMVTPSGGALQSLGQKLGGGEIKGLLDFRNTELPSVVSQLSELVSQAATQLNKVSNAYSSVPPPATLSGKNTGLDATTALSGFTGKTNVTILDPATGAIQKRVEVDFDAGTMTADGDPLTATDFVTAPADFLSTLNTMLGGAGSASFSNGALSISASGGAGVAVTDDPTTPSNKAGQGFSQFFGLNDLVSSPFINDYRTGLKGTDPSDFTGSLTLRLSVGAGSSIRDITVTPPVGGTVDDLVASMNAATGALGTFSLDSNGSLLFQSAPNSSVSFTVLDDNTVRGTNGPTMTELFGLGDTQRASRLSTLNVRTDIKQDPLKLPLATVNLAAAPGTAALLPGDSRAADAFTRAGLQSAQFNASGTAIVTTSLADFSANFSATLSGKAAAATAAEASANAISAEADARRSSAEGVNLDQELISLTMYQQAYSASARMTQAAKDIYDILLNMVQ